MTAGRPASTRATESSYRDRIDRLWPRIPSTSGPRESKRGAVVDDDRFAPAVAAGDDEGPAQRVEQQVVQRAVRQEQPDLG